MSKDVEKAVAEAVDVLSEFADGIESQTTMAIDKRSGHALILIREDEEDPGAAADACAQLIKSVREGVVDPEKSSAAATNNVH